jgi:hypothetical protein
MPLRDHFHGEFDVFAGWEPFHAAWPVFIARKLNWSLPSRYKATPAVHLGVHVAADVTTFDRGVEPIGDPTHFQPGAGNGTAVWSAPAPTATLEIGLPAQDEFSVRITDVLKGNRAVAALELVSPGNKDRAEHREAFLAKCAALLEQQISVAIVDVVTNRSANLHAELLTRFGGAPVEPMALGTLYATVYRATVSDNRWGLDVWAYPLTVGEPLPTVPLWLAPELATPLDLEATYCETARDMRFW